MSEDIHKWSDGRYTLMFDEHTFFVFDNEKEERMTALETTKRLNEQQATIQSLKEENEVLLENLFERQEYFRKSDKEYHERIMKYQTEIKGLKNTIFNLKNEIYNLKDDKNYYTDEKRFDLYD